MKSGAACPNSSVIFFSCWYHVITYIVYRLFIAYQSYQQLIDSENVFQRKGVVIWRNLTDDLNENQVLDGVLTSQSCLDICQVYTTGGCLIFRFELFISLYLSLQLVVYIDSTVWAYTNAYFDV